MKLQTDTYGTRMFTRGKLIAIRPMLIGWGWVVYFRTGRDTEGALFVTIKNFR